MAKIASAVRILDRLFGKDPAYVKLVKEERRRFARSFARKSKNRNGKKGF